MSKAYGTSNKSTGREASLNKHPSSDPAGTSSEKFSQMNKVDMKEQHNKTVANMSAQSSHLKEMPITDLHAYKRQSHAVRPNGEIKSFVNEKADESAKPKVMKPGGKKGEYGGKDHN